MWSRIYFSLFTVACTLNAVLSEPPVTSNELKEITEAITKDCQARTGASDVEKLRMKDHQMPESHEGLCMLECIMDATKIMQDGKFDADGMVAALAVMYEENSPILEKLTKVAEACRKEVVSGEDRCTNAKIAMGCMLKQGEIYGYELPKHA